MLPLSDFYLTSKEEDHSIDKAPEPGKSGRPGDKSGDLFLDEVDKSSWFEGSHMDWV